MDNLTAESIASEIENTIENYEPRVSLQQTIVTPIFDDNEFNVRIVYDIIGINVPTQELEFVLLPTR
jgi:predicted component of type VI protein secretion system